MPETPLMNQRPARSTAAARYRGLLIIWGAQLSSLFLFFVLIQFTRTAERAEPNRAVLLALGGAALSTFAFSFVVKLKLLGQAAAERRPDLATTAYITAFALCEACAILGVAAHFATGARESLYFFVPAALGFVLHFPRRQHFEDYNNDQGRAFKSTL